MLPKNGDNSSNKQKERKKRENYESGGNEEGIDRQQLNYQRVIKSLTDDNNNIVINEIQEDFFSLASHIFSKRWDILKEI